MSEIEIIYLLIALVLIAVFKDFFKKLIGAITGFFIKKLKFFPSKKYAADYSQQVVTALKKINHEAESIKPNIKFVSSDKIDGKTNFGFIQLKPGLSEPEIQRLVICHFPYVSMYLHERKFLEPELKSAFFNQLRARLAKEMGRADVEDEIVEELTIKGGIKNFEIFGDIFNSSERLDLFREEARARYVREKDYPSESSKKEFTKIIKEIRKGLFHIIRIGNIAVKNYVERLKGLVKSKSYNGIFLLARGTHIKTADSIVESIKKEPEYNLIKDISEEQYKWVFAETQRQTPVDAKKVKILLKTSK